MKKVAIFGGTFDPVHLGHLAMAKQVLHQGIQEVWFMPARQTPLKDRPLTDYSIRVKMIRRAIAPYRKMFLSTLENELPVPSYTIQTVRELKKRFPQNEFYWILGQDQVAQLDRWKSIQELKQEVHFLCLARAGASVVNPEKIKILEFHHGASSTAVRQGEWHWVPKCVRACMIQHQLYLDEILQHRLSRYRSAHCRSMTEIAVKLALAHHVNPQKAYIAGMLHDIAKELDPAEARRLMEILHPDQLHVSCKIWHQWLGADYVCHHLGITDPQICSAIAHHVQGKGKSKLAKIIYIADKIDPGRGYDIQKQLSVSLKDLDEGVALIQAEQKHYLKTQEEMDV